MGAVTWVHVAGGLVALVAGTAAMALRKGGGRHATAGTWFCAAMLVAGLTAAILEPLKTPPESPVGGIMVCYFVITAWLSARARSGTPGRLDRIACAAVLLIALAMLVDGTQRMLVPAGRPAIPPAGAVLALGGLCLLAGLGDLRWILRGRLSPGQRIVRHLWRMCFAFFIATGSFFLGQQDVMPMAVRGSPILIVLAFAPFALMLYWLVRVRCFGAIGAGRRVDAVGDRRPEG